MNDESMGLTREIDTALNIQKLFIHTPVRSEIQQKQIQTKLPAMYLAVLQRSTSAVALTIENYFAHYLSQFKQAVDKEELLKKLFVKLFTEKDSSSLLE
jgi:hypothetical protein